MITREELLRTAELTGLKPFQEEKHYIQTLILRSIYSRISDELIFKGGTALWFFHGLNRFSEDLDFSLVRNLNIDALIKKIVDDLELMGVEATLRVGRDNFRIGAEGPLFTREIERCFVRVEVSRKGDVVMKSIPEEYDPIYMDVLPFSIMIMDPGEILAEKVRVIMTRDRSRDLYDLWFLLKKKVDFDRGLVDKKLAYYKKEFNPEEFIERIKLRKDYWETELKPLIMGKLPDFDLVLRELLATNTDHL
jgi:hypothetical protein